MINNFDSTCWGKKLNRKQPSLNHFIKLDMLGVMLGMHKSHDTIALAFEADTTAFHPAIVKSELQDQCTS